MNGPTSIYRYYDADRKLIYVGITGRGAIRQAQHNSLAEWWRFVSTQEVEHVDTRVEALRRERELIERFRPPFNREHNTGWERLRANYLADAQDDECDAQVQRYLDGYHCGWNKSRHAADEHYLAASTMDGLLRSVIDGDWPTPASLALQAAEQARLDLEAAIDEHGLTALVDEKAAEVPF